MSRLGVRVSKKGHFEVRSIHHLNEDEQRLIENASSAADINIFWRIQ